MFLTKMKKGRGIIAKVTIISKIKSKIFGFHSQRKRSWRGWLLKHKQSQRFFQRFVGSVNEDKDGERDQS